jgi:hypothetical protein
MMIRLVLALIVLLSAPAVARAEAVITPGQDEVIAEMLGRGRVLGGDCTLSSASIDKTYIVANYACSAGDFKIELRALDDAKSDLGTSKFAIVAGSAPDALRNDLRDSVLANEGRFQWFTPANGSDGAPREPGHHPSAPASPRGLAHRIMGSGWLATLWLIPPLGVILALARWRIRRDVLLVAGTATLVGLVVRFCLPATPANYFTDILGPAGATTPPWTMRAAGIAGLYSLIARVVPLTAAGVFAIQRVLGSLSVGLICAATTVRPTGEVRASSAVTIPAIAGTLFAVDPMQAWLASSDAMHVPALFGFAAGAFVYASTCNEQRTPWWRLGLLFGCALLPGLTRVELALAPLAYPLLIGSRRPRPLAIVILVAAVAIAIGLSLSTTFASSVEHPSLERAHAWSGTLIGAASRLREGWLSPGLSQVALVGSVVALVRKQWRLALALVALIGMHAVRLFSPLAGANVVGALAYARHDILNVAILIVIAAWAIDEMVDALCAWLPARIPPALVIAAVAGWIALQLPAFRRAPYTYQAEYRFLAQALPKVEPSCRIVAVWHRGVNGLAFESALALPHPVLAYEHPPREWLIVSEPGDLDRIGSGCAVYFESSFCQLDPDSPRGDDLPETRKILHALQPVCARLAESSVDTIAEQRVEARALLWPYRTDSVRLALHRLNLR